MKTLKLTEKGYNRLIQIAKYSDEETLEDFILEAVERWLSNEQDANPFWKI